MAVKIQSTKDWRINGIKAAIYGFSGVGKTRLLATIPDTIIISAERGLLSLASQDIPYIEVETLKDVQDAFDFLQGSDEAKQYKNIGYDSLSDTCERLLGWYKHKGGIDGKPMKDPRKAYGMLADSVGALIRNIRDIPDKNVFFTAKMARRDDEDTGKWWYEPMLPGRVLPNGLPYFVDEVFCMQMGEDGEGKPTRFLQTESDRRIVSKDRSGTLDRNEQADLSIIVNKIKGGAGNG